MTITFNDLGNLGHLGNQMFQYAAIKGISAYRGDDYKIPSREFFGNKYPTKSFLDDSFNLNCKRGIGNFETVVEKSFSYDESILTIQLKDFNLYGYFQSEKYFKHIENQIRKEYSFSEKLLKICLEYIESVNSNKDIISLHIRRGDYLNLQSHHPTIPLEYYSTALRSFPNLPVLIFSDDPDWCLGQELFDSDRFLVSESNSPEFDLCLMSLCKYHIIANSSFSWWGAWLSNSKNVIAPKVWFGPSLSNNKTEDLYCEGWRIL